MSTCIVSVIVPTYKPKAYLWQCLDSIYDQSLNKKLFEVILILNGCNEPYKSQIEEWVNSHHDLNVNLIQTNCGGVSNARNIGLDEVRGEYITFIDDDDYVSPTYLEELLNNANKDVVSLSNAYSFKDGTADYEEYYVTKSFYKSHEKNNVSVFSARSFFSGPVYKLIHKDIIGNRRFCNKLQRGEDTLFMFYISDRIRKLSFTSCNAIYYRRVRLNSATTKHKDRRDIYTNQTRQLIEYIKLIVSHPFSYSPLFSMTRVLSALNIFGNK